LNGALAGVRVLDLSRLLPGGYATLLMADLGADVVKVEEPGRGDHIRWTPPAAGKHSSGHIALNRAKRSLTLNLKTDRGRALLLDLVERVDVLVESFRPGVMAELGLGHEELCGRNPRLVYCAITGYGQDGPRARAAGHDVNYMGYAGALSITGEPGRPPVLPGVQVGDLGGGAMAALVSILAALLRRSRTGRGGFCDVSMTDGVFSWLSIHAAAFVTQREVPKAGAMPLTGAYPCYHVYPAADGYVTVGALEPHFWRALCEGLGRADLIGDAYATGTRRTEVIASLEGLFRTRTRAEWMELLADVDACVGPVNDLAEAFADDQLRARGMIVEGELEGVGAWTLVGDPLRAGHERASFASRPPPGLGEHTEEVLAEIGLSPTDVELLRSEGVV
jgi:alpha-methylacyl-CoA racemase